MKEDAFESSCYQPVLINGSQLNYVFITLILHFQL